MKPLSLSLISKTRERFRRTFSYRCGPNACNRWFNDLYIDLLKAKGCQHIKVLVLVAAPEGIKALEKAHPDIELYCASIDDHLNEQGYIIPGLGDAGDKIFGTK